MTDPLPLIGGGEPLSALLAALEHADAVVVLEDGLPQGVVTRQDVLGFMAAGPKR
jgi:cystathionine beta-synthase